MRGFTAPEEKAKPKWKRPLPPRKPQEISEELEARRYADAELAGTNSCVDDKRLAKLFLKHRMIAQELQYKYGGKGVQTEMEKAHIKEVKTRVRKAVKEINKRLPNDGCGLLDR